MSIRLNFCRSVPPELFRSLFILVCRIVVYSCILPAEEPGSLGSVARLGHEQANCIRINLRWVGLAWTNTEIGCWSNITRCYVKRIVRKRIKNCCHKNARISKSVNYLQTLTLLFFGLIHISPPSYFLASIASRTRLSLKQHVSATS